PDHVVADHRVTVSDVDPRYGVLGTLVVVDAVVLDEVVAVLKISRFDCNGDRGVEGVRAVGDEVAPYYGVVSKRLELDPLCADRVELIIADEDIVRIVAVAAARADVNALAILRRHISCVADRVTDDITALGCHAEELVTAIFGVLASNGNGFLSQLLDHETFDSAEGPAEVRDALLRGGHPQVIDVDVIRKLDVDAYPPIDVAGRKRGLVLL